MAQTNIILYAWWVSSVLQPCEKAWIFSHLGPEQSLEHILAHLFDCSQDSLQWMLPPYKVWSLVTSARVFSVVVPCKGNLLPLEVQTSPFLLVFKNRVKTLHYRETD